MHTLHLLLGQRLHFIGSKGTLAPQRRHKRELQKVAPFSGARRLIGELGAGTVDLLS